MDKDYDIVGYKFAYHCKLCKRKYGSDQKNDSGLCPLHDEKFKERLFIKKLLLNNETKGLNRTYNY